VTLPIGTEWTETQVLMEGTQLSYPILWAAVRTGAPSEEGETPSLYPYGPPEAFVLKEVVIPNATGADYDALMDQIVGLIEAFVQPFLDTEASLVTNKRYFQGPEELTAGS
jgi:hypothetical protein